MFLETGVYKTHPFPSFITQSHYDNKSDDNGGSANE